MIINCDPCCRGHPSSFSPSVNLLGGKITMKGICFARNALRRVIEESGDEACFNSRCFQDEQAKPMWVHQPCMCMLAEAVEHEIPSELLRLGKRSPIFMLQMHLADHLRYRKPHLSPDHAKWIVESWSMSLGLTHFNHIMPLTMLRPDYTQESAADSVLCNACVFGDVPSP